MLKSLPHTLSRDCNFCAKKQDHSARGKRSHPLQANQRNYFKGFDSILTLSIPGVPMAAQKPIFTRVPEGTMSALTE